MKKGSRLFVLPLALSLLAGCQTASPPSPKPSEPVGPPPPAESDLVTCRIVDGAAEGALLLASEDTLYRLSAEGLVPEETPLRDGMMVEVAFDGAIAETWPAQFGSVLSLTPLDAQVDDRCGLYLQVLEDLWNKDSGLNSGIEHLGVDLSAVTDLTDLEKRGVAWRFAELHGLADGLLEQTWEELAEAGYIDRENLSWEDGLLFTIDTDEDAVWSLPNLGPGEKPPVLNAFDAHKWRSGLGAYFFMDCCGQRQEDGSWTYSVARQAIS